VPKDILTPARTALVKLRRCASARSGHAAGNPPAYRGRLDALLVVDVHVQIRTVLLGERDAFVVDERGMLDGGDSGANRVLDAFGRVRMRRNPQTEIRGLLDGGAQFLGGEFDGLRIAAMREHRARGQHLDVIGAAMRKFADLLPHFPGTVRLTERRSQGQLDIRRPSRSWRRRPR
jgi:hypothetical protein